MPEYNPKKGEGHIWPCVLTVILCMLLAVFITFANSVAVVKQTIRNSRVVLDNYVMTDSIAIYNAIKQGSDKDESLNAAKYRSALADFCTFAQSGSYYYNYDDDGNVQYYISAPSLSYVKDKSLKIETHYKIYVPIYFAGVRVGTAEVPVSVRSKLTEKW